VYDQPLLLITEILQDGSSTGIEIGNFGPATVDISCANVSRTDEFGQEVIYNIPNGTIVPVGGVFTYLFNGAFNSGDRATFAFSFVDLMIDEVSINEGTLFGDNIIRIDPVDDNDDSDWMVVNDCITGSFGTYNPELPVYTANGTTTSLQSKAPSSAECSSTITVLDIEAPTCASQDTLIVDNGTLTLLNGMCVTETISVPSGIVADVNVRDFIATLDNVGGVTVLLTSPLGTEVTLFSDVCEGTEDIMVSLDDSAASNILTASCNPLGNGNTFRPQEPFKSFYGEDAGGDWVLSIYTDGTTAGTIDSWILDVITNSPYAQMDTLLSNDEGLCAAEFTWIHPVIADNCCEGGIQVTYDFANEVTGIVSTDTEDVLTPSGFINFEGLAITREFSVGTTTITYTLTDISGNTSTCGFEVQVVDDEAPEFTNGCDDVEILLEPGECEGVLPNIPVTADNCAVDSVRFLIGADEIDINMLPIGMNNITLISTDIYGNMDTCMFVANVVEFDSGSTTLACNNSINLSLGVDCTAEFTPGMILEGDTQGCFDDFCIEVTTENGVVVDNIFDINDVGQSFIVSITDCTGSGNSCWGTVNVEDKLLPEIECPANVDITCNQNAEERYPIGHPLAGQLITGEAILLTCEANSNIYYVDDIIDNGVCQDPRVQILRRWTVVDNSGNSTSCDQLITVLAYDPLNVTFPRDYDYTMAFSCIEVTSNPDIVMPVNTGFPMLSDTSIFGDNYCDINVGYWDEVLQDVNCPAAYSILRHWIIENECLPIQQGINPLRHIQRIKVDDNTAPSLIQVSL